MTRILVLEDETHLAAGLKLNLSLEGYTPVLAPTIRAARQALVEAGPFALYVFDVMLPDGDGIALCHALREAGDRTPVLMLTALSAPDHRVRGLEAGADDYLPKPFDLAELLARVKALLRRAQWDSTPVAAAQAVRIGRLQVDFAAMTASADGQAVTLTRLEFDVLRYFSAHAGRVLSREELLAEVWQLTGQTTRTVDNFVMRLRRHVELDPKQPQHLVSVRGAGYKLVL
jgi:DNA-binding response OmpR family regulator